MNLLKAKFLPSNIIPFPRIIQESQFTFHASRITFSFIKTRVIFASSPSLKQFRNPSSLSPSHPVQSSCSLSHVTEGCIQSPVDQGKQLPARSSLCTHCHGQPGCALSRTETIPSPPHPCLGAQGSWVVQFRQTCSTFLLPQQQAGCQGAGFLGFGHMHLTRKRRSSISLSASCRNAERRYKCICTSVKFSLIFVWLALCSARKIYLFYSVSLKEVRRSFLKKHRNSLILKICKNCKLLLVETSTSSRSKCCLFILLVSL